MNRAERLLDAAAELLIRWGYQRVTIEDVARHAGVGKGTVYLHFRTKEALFLTVLLRAHRRVVSAVVDRMVADPVEILPSRVMRSSYLDIAADPVARLLYLGDAEVLGRLTHEASDSLGGRAERRGEVLREYLTLLRSAGGLRTDLDIDAQVHVLSAVALGFYIADSASPVADPAQRADLLAHTVAVAIEAPEPRPEALAEVAPRIVAGMRSAIAIVDEEWRRRVR